MKIAHAVRVRPLRPVAANITENMPRRKQYSVVVSRYEITGLGNSHKMVYSQNPRLPSFIIQTDWQNSRPIGERQRGRKKGYLLPFNHRT